LGLTGGATNVGGYVSEEAIAQRLKGMDKAEISLKLGAPSQRVEVDKLRETWTHDSSLVSVIGGQCRVSIAFEGEKATAAMVNSFDYSPLAAPLGSCRQIIRALD